MQFSFNLHGSRELEALLAALPEKIEKRIMRQALRKAAQPVLKQARANVRALRVTGINTDPLARGLKVRALPRRKRRGRVGVAVQTPTRGELGISGDSKWYYPAHIELGTQHAEAQPYLRGALEQAKKQVEAILVAELRRGIEREAGRA